MQKGVAHHGIPKEQYSARPVLTRKEMEVLVLVCKGMTNKEMSILLSRSVGAIRNRMRGMFHKFGASNRTELVACAFRGRVIT